MQNLLTRIIFIIFAPIYDKLIAQYLLAVILHIPAHRGIHPRWRICYDTAHRARCCGTKRMDRARRISRSHCRGAVMPRCLCSQYRHVHRLQVTPHIRCAACRFGFCASFFCHHLAHRHVLPSVSGCRVGGIMLQRHTPGSSGTYRCTCLHTC